MYVLFGGKKTRTKRYIKPYNTVGIPTHLIRLVYYFIFIGTRA